MDKVRQEILNVITKRLNAIIPNTPTVDAYAKALDKMTDKELALWIKALENGIKDVPDMDLNAPSDTIIILAPNLDKKNQLNMKRNLALAKAMGHDFFEQCWVTNPVTHQCTLSNRKYMVMDLPVRRQAQTLDEKISLPEDDTHVDELTGQVTGESKGASISFPEVQMLVAQNLTHTLEELLRVRGGDQTAWSVMKRDLIENGEFSLSRLEGLDSRAKVNQSLSTIMTSMHIKNNL